MDTTQRLDSEPRTMSSITRGRRLSSDSNSSEFEFWMVRNPADPHPNLLSADELFVDGVILPLHLLSLHHNSDPPDITPQTGPESTASVLPPVIDPIKEPGPGPKLSSETQTAGSGSNRWKDIFKKNSASSNQGEKDKEREKKKKGGNGRSRASPAELNINIWPFTRSRSAGNSGDQPKLFSGTRRVNSAPCSRSNSSGESNQRKWPNSPARPGVHVGRSSPVWQARRGTNDSKNSKSAARNTEKGSKKGGAEGRRSKASSSRTGGGKARVLNVNIPTCIGYRHHLGCRSNESSAIGLSRDGTTGGGGNGEVGSVGNGGNHFNLRTLFNKKSVLTSH